MPYIIDLKGREVLDSRGNPTVEVDIILESGARGKGMVPSGASTGDKEALELRDNDKKRYLGKGVLKAVKNINEIIKPKLIGMDIRDQAKIDQFLLKLDGTKNKSKLGANAILAVSLACLKAASNYYHMPLYRYLGGINAHTLPVPMCNVINGGMHADSNIDFQEYMLMPIGAKSFHEGIRMVSEVFHTLKKLLKNKGYTTGVGDEGGFAPNFKDNEEPLKAMMAAIKEAGYIPGKDFVIALDVAASEFYVKSAGVYLLRSSKEYRRDDLIRLYQELVEKYPIVSIEDGLDQNDWEGWQKLTKVLGNKIQLVGDDLFVTNPLLLEKGIKNNVANAILIKLNQIGTVTEACRTMELAKREGYRIIVSHRSGETEDTTIADLAVAFNTGQIKTGSLSRTDRIAKYNRLLRIEEELEQTSTYYGKQCF